MYEMMDSTLLYVVLGIQLSFLMIFSPSYIATSDNRTRLCL